jgi:hypothetical protein
LTPTSTPTNTPTSTPTPTPPTCPNATITMHVTQCDAPLVGASVELRSSWGDRYGPKPTDGGGKATFSVIGGSQRLWYATVNGARMGPTIKVTECGGTGTIDPVFPCRETPLPTPTVLVEVLGVERVPTTGMGMPLAPFLVSLWLASLGSLLAIFGGLLRRLSRYY